MRTNSGSGFDSGASDYSWVYIGTHSGIYYDNYDSSDDHMRAGGDPFTHGSDASNAFSMKVTIHAPSDTTYETLIYYELSMLNAAANPVPQWLNGVGHFVGASAITGIQFLMSSGDFDTGRFSLFKIKHS